MRYAIGVVALSLLVGTALAGCGGGPAAEPDAALSSSAPPPPPPSSTRLPEAEALLAEHAPLEDLHWNLVRSLQLLDSLRVVSPNAELGPGVNGTVTIDMDYTGNCSGSVFLPDGTEVRIVKRGDELVVGGGRLGDRWQRLDRSDPLFAFCDAGAAHAVDNRQSDSASTWMLTSGHKLGMGKVEGRDALHIRQQFGESQYDIWLAAFEDRLYPVKVVRTLDDRSETRLFTQINNARIEKLPAPGKINDAGAAT